MSEKGFIDQPPSKENPPLIAVHDIRESWSDVPEVPLSWRDPDELITSESFNKWREDLNTLKRLKINIDGLEKFDGYVLAREALEEYKKLHFLSRNNAEQGMLKIVEDIRNNFSPSDTLIYLESGSIKFFYDMVSKDLKDYGTFRERGRQGVLEVLDKNGYKKETPDEAQHWLYLDDWILTGQQFASSVRALAKRPNQVYAYYLVVSDRGKKLFDGAGSHGKCVFKINGNDGPDSFFGDYPIYGFHKIPDSLPHIYAGSAKGGRDPEYSIFPPDKNDYLVGRHTRLVEH